MTQPSSTILALAFAVACSTPPASEPAPERCTGGSADPADCLAPNMPDAHYIEQSNFYFDTMDSDANRDVETAYSEMVARWEWPPWLMLTGIGRDQLVTGDLLLRLYPSTVPDRDCRAFDTNPFGRCRVVFYYADPAHEGRGCPIYEEFTFNEDGEITFIEAWSDQPELLPFDATVDEWYEGDALADHAADRLSTRVPGLGVGDGLIDLEGDDMNAAAQADPDVAEFQYRGLNYFEAWSSEYEAAGDDLWERGCGW